MPDALCPHEYAHELVDEVIRRCAAAGKPITGDTAVVLIRSLGPFLGRFCLLTDLKP
jgi:hypothetical protein